MARVKSVLSRAGGKRFPLTLLAIGIIATAVGWSASSSEQVALGQILPPPNDLLALGQAGGDTPAMAAVQHNPEPPLTATPRAVCGPSSHPLDGVQGRVPASALAAAPAGGYTCNMTLVSHQGQSGGFKVLRYVDKQGHECAFYDTALLYPTNAVSLAGPPSLGVAVLDMSDPAHPVQTATLSEPSMQSPHESLSLNPRRGLLGAVLGNPNTHPGLVSIYDASADCRHPVLDSTELVARFGHEGNFSPDGNTFYAAGTSVKAITAIDVTDPKNPHAIWQGNEVSHGLTISDDGKRAYVADSNNAQLLILDTSQIQARKPDPHAREVSRLTWGPATIPQNAIPITIHGKHYILEFDEYAFKFGSPSPPPDTVGAGRLVDNSDETHPRVVSNLRLEVDQPAEHHAAAGDPGTLNPLQSYAAHYCYVPREVDPEIVACSFITSGLRVFDIRDPLHPREVAYFVAPPKTAFENGGNGSNFAMSRPAFAPERREIWYSDGSSGFYALRVPASAWPDPTGLPANSCLSPSGLVSGNRVGPVALGEPRADVRAQLRYFSTKHRVSMDYLCLTGGGIRVGYPSAALLRSLSPSERARTAGRLVLVLTSNPIFALDGVRPGARLAAAARRLRLGRGIQIGLNTWYVVASRTVNGVLKIRHGVVQEIGLVDRRLTSGRAQSRRLLGSFT
jgi:hypothetical protein